MNTEIKTFIINKLESGEYLLTKNCFGEYIKSLFEQNNYEDFDLIKYSLKKEDGWKNIESRLEKTLSILKISEKELIQQFGLKSDLPKDQEEKIFDVLYEFKTVVILNEKGFTEIKKVKQPTNEGRRSDFVAQYKNEKYAIEVKTIRPDKKIERTSIPLPAHHEEKARIGTGLGYKIDTLDEMLFEKINEILPKIRQQLENTAKSEQCQKKLWALWIGKEATRVFSAFQGNNFIGQIANKIRKSYPGIDYFVFNGYWYPELKQIVGSVPITNRNSGIFPG